MVRDVGFVYACETLAKTVASDQVIPDGSWSAIDKRVRGDGRFLFLLRWIRRFVCLRIAYDPLTLCTAGRLNLPNTLVAVFSPQIDCRTIALDVMEIGVYFAHSVEVSKQILLSSGERDDLILSPASSPTRSRGTGAITTPNELRKNFKRRCRKRRSDGNRVRRAEMSIARDRHLRREEAWHDWGGFPATQSTSFACRGPCRPDYPEFHRSRCAIDGQENAAEVEPNSL